MISARSEFQFVSRGFADTAVLIPGWASDYRIFSALDIPFNYLIPIRIKFSDFEKELISALDKNKITKFHLIGWSLGGFLAAAFAGRNHSLIESLVFLSVARKFQKSLLEEIGLKLKKNKRAYLYKFYRDCFSQEDMAGWVWFKKNLLIDYVNNIQLEDLLSGLDYLSGATLKPQDALRLKVRIFHGKKDLIMPFSDAEKMSCEFNRVDFTALAGIGHACFLNYSFKEKFCNG